MTGGRSAVRRHLAGAIAASTLGVVLAPTAGRATEPDAKQVCVTASEDAQKLRDDHHLTAARERLLVCTREACPQVVRKDCSAWLTEVEASLPSVVLAAHEGGNDLLDVKVTLDGTPLTTRLDGKAVFVDPGPHTFQFTAAGKPPVDRHVVVKEGERNREIAVDFGPAPVAAPAAAPPHAVEPPPHEETGSSLVPAYVASGVAVVAVGGFVYFGLTGKSDVNGLRDTCGQTHSCKQEDVDAAKQKLLFADISLGVGIVAAGVAAYFFITHKSSTPHTAAVGSDLRFGAGPVAGGGGAATFGGRF